MISFRLQYLGLSKWVNNRNDAAGENYLCEESFPPGFFKPATNIHEIQLNSNRLQRVPSEILTLSTLIRLDLSNNDLTILPSGYILNVELNFQNYGNYPTLNTCICKRYIGFRKFTIVEHYPQVEHSHVSRYEFTAVFRHFLQPTHSITERSLSSPSTQDIRRQVILEPTNI